MREFVISRSEFRKLHILLSQELPPYPVDIAIWPSLNGKLTIRTESSTLMNGIDSFLKSERTKNKISELLQKNRACEFELTRRSRIMEKTSRDFRGIREGVEKSMSGYTQKHSKTEYLNALLSIIQGTATRSFPPQPEDEEMILNDAILELSEAQEEIDRLRAALKQIADIDIYENETVRAQKIAEDALKGME